MTEESPEAAREKKLTLAINQAAEALAANNLTVGETVFALQTMTAHVLSRQNTSVANGFFRFLRQDILKRRLAIMKGAKDVRKN